jgi:rod shape determining protein RodA
MVALAEQRRWGRTPSRQGWLRADSIDWVLWGVPLILCFLAGILIASTQRQADYADWYQHWITAAVGMVVALLAARLPMDRLQVAQWPIYILTNLSLVAVRFVGTSALGAQRWINIAGFHVQPSEFAKVAAILLLAGLLSRFPVERPVDLIRPIALISVPWALVFLQPDLGTSLVYGAILLVMLFWAGLSGSWLMLLLSPLVTAIIAGVAPWGLAIWIPLMALLAWRWSRLFRCCLRLLPPSSGITV